MNIEQLIKQLLQYPPDMEVYLLDWRKCLSDDSGDGSSSGVYPKFEIALQDLESDEKEYWEERHDKIYKPCVTISFENDDYDYAGRAIWDENKDESPKQEQVEQLKVLAKKWETLNQSIHSIYYSLPSQEEPNLDQDREAINAIKSAFNYSNTPDRIPAAEMPVVFNSPEEALDALKMNIYFLDMSGDHEYWLAPDAQTLREFYCAQSGIPILEFPEHVEEIKEVTIDEVRDIELSGAPAAESTIGLSIQSIPYPRLNNEPCIIISSTFF